MRDLIDLIQILSEASNLQPSEFNKRPQRFAAFKKKILAGEPFTTIDDQEVHIAKVEAQRFEMNWDDHQQKFIDPKEAQFAQLARGSTYNGQNTIPLSKLKKTTEFGGAGVAVGADPAAGGKASYAVKPQDIGICDKDISAHDLYDIIKNNGTLNATDYGKIVIALADYIVAGEAVVLPEDAQKNDKLRAAIQDNAGEYLGVLALLYYRSRFNKREEFNKWLGGTTDDLVVRFPSAANYALADSFAQLTNSKTSHSVNISSKGKDGGAAPSIRGLQIPEHIKNNPKLKNGVEFVKICQERDTISQAFDGMDLLYQARPESINKEWHKFLPFNPKLKEKIIASFRGQDLPFSKEWQGILGSVASKDATDGGKIIYAIKREVAHAINTKDALPEFKDMVLEILEMNFVQQYTDYENKHKGEFTFATQWPAKLDGKVSLENKSSAKDPTSGGFSFKLGRTDDDVSSEPGEPAVDDGAPEVDFDSQADKLAGVASAEPSKERPVGDVGREKRKPIR